MLNRRIERKALAKATTCTIYQIILDREIFLVKELKKKKEKREKAKREQIQILKRAVSFSLRRRPGRRERGGASAPDTEPVHGRRGTRRPRRAGRLPGGGRRG